ncbi:hypothetical protein yinte0001_18420 [Yersinia intermedia ATCC 29909]|nr:hypothetical protein yinte0001_18420 [Yersinia intermedia ATCC 29909]
MFKRSYCAGKPMLAAIDTLSRQGDNNCAVFYPIQAKCNTP